MKIYLGTKVIMAATMNKKAYCDYRGWVVPENEDPLEAGYLVEYTDGGTPNHANHKGYISWSPAALFDKAYRQITDLTFGLALEALKRGMAVARRGWNGEGMCVYMVPANSYPAQTEFAKNIYGDQLVPYDAYFALKKPDNRVSTWAPSCSDVIAEDWYVAS